MKKILFSIATIGIVGSAVVGATGAFFSDTETSSGNTFSAGAIDLTIDNESYYNGAVSSSTSWLAQDLKEGLLFFNFSDLKPDDEGEDTISLHVSNNDAWACMDLSLTSNDDKSSNEPELKTGDEAEDTENTWDGELAQNLRMFWWADDGDNVYEVGENALIDGVKTLSAMFSASSTATSTLSIPLADATHNVWGTPGPLTGNETAYIAKAWCFGDLTLTPITQDGLGHQNGATNGPLVRGTGVSCDGAALGNETQTDGVTMDLAFRAVQYRHNTSFTCGGTQSRTAKLTVVKKIVNDNGGNNTIPDFHLFVVGDVLTPVTSGATTTLAAGAYTVTESGVSGYQASFSGDCDASGQVTLNPGDEKTCILTNNDIAPSITLIKNVVGGAALPVQFTMRIDGNVVPQNTSVAVTANSAHTINEDLKAGYHFTSITGAGCPASTSTPVVLNEGEAITCTITNTAN